MIKGFCGALLLRLFCLSLYGQAELERPVFNYSSGIYKSAITLTVVNMAADSTLRYTTDGSKPVVDSGEWPGYLRLQNRSGEADLFSLIPTNPSMFPRDGDLDPMPLDKLESFGWRAPAESGEKLNIIRVRAFKDGFEPSPVATATFLIRENGEPRYRFPVVSIAANADDLFDFEQGIYTAGIWFLYGGGWGADRWGFPWGNYYLSGRDYEIGGHWTFLEPDGRLLWEGDMGIRVHGGGSRSLPQKSLRLYARNEYGKNSFDAPFFGENHRSSFRRLILRNAGQDSIETGTMFRDGLMQGLVRHKEHLATQAFRPTVVFINGEYWGIHNLRERFDRHYLGRTFGADPDNVDYLEGNAEVKEGSGDTYLELLTFLGAGDLDSPEALSYIEERIDWRQYIDYVIAQLYFGNHDWPGNNIDFWRDPRVSLSDPAPLDGRWRWMLFDTDLGFAHEVEPEFNHLELITATGGDKWPNPDWSTFLFRSLLENTVIREHFIQRLASLLSTTFNISRVLAQIDYFEEMFAPEMPEHLLRWGLLGDLNQWRSHVEKLRHYAKVRPDILREHVRAFFELPGLANVTVDAQPAAGGSIRMAGKEISPATPGLEKISPLYPFTVSWFEAVPLLVEAVPAPGYQFDHWQDDPALKNALRWHLPEAATAITAVFIADPIIVTAGIYFSGAGTPVEGGFFYDSLGWVGVHPFPWVYTQCYGWLKAIGSGGEEWMFYAPEWGWRYTRPSILPYYYDFHSGDWVIWDCR